MVKNKYTMGQSEGSTDLFDILLVSPSQPALGRDTMTGPILVFHYRGPVKRKGKHSFLLDLSLSLGMLNIFTSKLPPD